MKMLCAVIICQVLAPETQLTQGHLPPLSSGGIGARSSNVPQVPWLAGGGTHVGLGCWIPVWYWRTREGITAGWGLWGLPLSGRASRSRGGERSPAWTHWAASLTGSGVSAGVWDPILLAALRMANSRIWCHHHLPPPSSGGNCSSLFQAISPATCPRASPHLLDWPSSSKPPDCSATYQGAWPS